MQTRPKSKTKLLHSAFFALALAVCALLASCENILETIPRKNTGGGTRALPRKAARRRQAELIPAR